MKHPLTGFLFLFALLAFFSEPETLSRAQNVEGQIIASEFGEYQVWGSGTNTFTFTPASCQVSGGGRNFAAFTRGLPVLIADPGNPAIDETVIAGLVNIQACSVQLTPTHKHIPPFYLASGTAGLQEAINSNLSSLGANTIILSAEWYRLGGSAAIIASVTGNSSLRLEDITTTPATWYQWNGSQYVPVSGSGGVGSLNALTGAVSITPASSNVTVAQSGSNIQIGFTGAAGVSSINGDKTPTQSIVGTGGISCSTVSGTTTCNYAGSAGSGAVGSGGPYNESGYTPGTTGTTVGPESNSLTLPLNLTTSQINTVLRTSNIRMHIQTGDVDTPFSNPNNDKVVIEKTGHPVSARSLEEWGAQCDLRTISGTISGNVLTAGGLSNADVGKTLVAVGAISGIPTVYEGTLGTNISGNNWNISTNPGLVISTSSSMDIGWDDTAGITAALTAQDANSFGNNIVLSVPIGNCLTHVQTKTPQALFGYSPYLSRITSFPGESIFSVTGGQFQKVGNFVMNVDNRIDATQAWQYIDATGTIHSVAGVYQPLMMLTAFANNPLGPGWFLGPGPNGGGAINGVASATNGSPTITVASSSVPVVGQQILFPYLSPIFSTTVSGVSGSTVTLAANYPGTTAAQSEFFAGTTAQNITSTTQCTLPCVIPATGRTFPMTLNVAGSLAPTPVGESNVAGFGVVKIDSEEFTYVGVTRSVSGTNSITLTAGQQNGTSAAEHDANAVVVPLNPFKYDAMPWPVTPTLNSGGTTPAGAEYYPAFNVGNFGYGTPLLDGSAGSSQGPLNGDFSNLLIQPWPAVSSGQNNVADFYFVGLPYSTYFHELNLFGQYCFVEGQPGLNTHDNASGDGDGLTTNNVACHASELGVAANFIAGGQTSQTNWNLYNGGNGSTPSGGGFNITRGVDDQTGGFGGGLIYTVISNIYNEPGGFAYGGAAGMELDCSNCQQVGWEYSGGGDIIVGGGRQNFIGGHIGSFAGLPFVNYGSNNSFNNPGTVSSAPQSNVYGTSSFLNFGPGMSGCVKYAGANGPCTTAGLGNNRQPSVGQSAETFATGNITTPYVSAIEGFITPEEFNTSTSLEVFPMSVGWTFDDTAPITHSYTGCNLGGGGECFTNNFNSGKLAIGPGQRIVPSLYTPTIAVKSTGGSGTFKFGFYNAYCGNTVFYSQILSVTSSWQTFTLPTADFSSVSGCDLGMEFANGSISTEIQVAFVDLQPVAQQITAQAVNLNGPTIYSGSGIPTGCGSTYANGSLYLNTTGISGSILYSCIGTTWTDIK